MKIEYSEIDIDQIMRYWSKGFAMKEGESLFDYKYFYDPKEGKVIFKLTINEKGDNQESLLG